MASHDRHVLLLQVNVFTENKRIVNVFESPAVGKVVFVNIGATAVGSIVQLPRVGDQVSSSRSKLSRTYDIMLSSQTKMSFQTCRLLTALVGDQVNKGDCLGYFQFGGSTCIMLTQRGKVQFDDDLLETAVTGTELYVQMGQQIGRATLER